VPVAQESLKSSRAVWVAPVHRTFLIGHALVPISRAKDDEQNYCPHCEVSKRTAVRKSIMQLGCTREPPAEIFALRSRTWPLLRAANLARG
jgi:hypothetical protein